MCEAAKFCKVHFYFDVSYFYLHFNAIRGISIENFHERGCFWKRVLQLAEHNLLP